MPWDFLVYGSSGYLGSHIVKWLKLKNKTFSCGIARLENRADLKAELQQHRPKFVICAAGVAGRPNIDWCETHRQETIRANFIGSLNLFDLCYMEEIHCTYFGSGCLYQYNEQHSLGSGIGYSEDEEPNFDGNFYTRTRIQLEKLLDNYPNVLNCRVLFPISDDFHPRSMPAKLSKYSKIFSVPNSYTVIDDLWPIVIDMAEMGVTGTYHIANPGVITNEDILMLYKQYIDPNCTWSLASPEEQLSYLKAPRPNCELSVKKLLSLYPDILQVRESTELIFRRMKENLSSSPPQCSQ